MLFDIHAHLCFPDFSRDLKEVIRKADENDIKIINSTVGLNELEPALFLTREYDNVYWTLGLSATELDSGRVSEAIDAVRRYRENIVGIGEVGLDYYWIKEEEKRMMERENFLRFIELSRELDLPLVVHSRNAEEDVLRILESENVRQPVILHCFSGTSEQASKAVSLGFYISIPTSIFYSKQKQKLAENLPLESILLESDSPYLAPTPKTRNEPVNIMKSVEKIVAIKGADNDVVVSQTTENARKAFKLSSAK